MIVENDLEIWKHAEEWRWKNNKTQSYMAEMLGVDRKMYMERARKCRFPKHVTTRGVGFMQMVADLTGEEFTIRPRT